MSIKLSIMAIDLSLLAMKLSILAIVAYCLCLANRLCTLAIKLDVLDQGVQKHKVCQGCRILTPFFLELYEIA